MISIIKTLYFNLHYFGLKGLRFPVLVFRNFKLEKLGGNIVLSNYNFGSIRLGQKMVGIIDDKNEKGIWNISGGGEIIFNGACKIGSASKISCNKEGRIVFGERVNITGRTAIICDHKISIGCDSLISWDCILMDTDFHKIFDGEKMTNPNKEISIDKHVWIGCRVTILGGTSLPDDSVIAAGSTITKSFAEKNTLIGGHNEILKRHISWEI